MGLTCLACNHTYQKNNCRFLMLPRERDKLKQWMLLLGFSSNDTQKSNPRVCSCHFPNYDKGNLPYRSLKTDKANNTSTKKNKLEEVVKPRGFERGLSLDKIVGVTNCKNELMFLLKWNNCLEYDLLKASEVNEKCPEVVIEYYESRSPVSQKCNINGKFDDKYELELIENPQPSRKVESKVQITKNDSDDEGTNQSAEDTTLSKIKKSDSNGILADANDMVNAAFSINVDDTNSVQVSYSLPLIESQPGDELMDTINSVQSNEQDNSHSVENTSHCHMPDLQDVEM